MSAKLSFTYELSTSLTATIFDHESDTSQSIAITETPANSKRYIMDLTGIPAGTYDLQVWDGSMLLGGDSIPTGVVWNGSTINPKPSITVLPVGGDVQITPPPTSDIELDQHTSGTLELTCTDANGDPATITGSIQLIVTQEPSNDDSVVLVLTGEVSDTSPDVVLVPYTATDTAIAYGNTSYVLRSADGEQKTVWKRGSFIINPAPDMQE